MLNCYQCWRLKTLCMYVCGAVSTFIFIKSSVIVISLVNSERTCNCFVSVYLKFAGFETFSYYVHFYVNNMYYSSKVYSL